MRLENLIKDTQDEMYKKIKEGRDMEDAEAKKVADVVAISALKYGVCPIRHPRIMFLISTVSPPSREIPAPTSCIPLCESSLF